MEGYNMFEQLLNRIDDTIAQFLLKANIEQNTQRRQVVKGRTNEPSEQEHKKPIKKEKKPGRNDPCSCGSGKKYKNCCGKNA
ncbi:TPA: SEC-C domain-containing protein [Candidatus Ventrenecus avicola]|nr:SEC-C domain-containing protein [Candidatus Ventrenecus avicola]